jgi:hypothetical protein
MTLCVSLQAIRMLTLEPECLKNRIDHHPTKNRQRWNRVLTETLKRLAVSLSFLDENESPLATAKSGLQCGLPSRCFNATSASFM